MKSITPTSMVNDIPVSPPKGQSAIAGSGVILSPGSHAPYIPMSVPSTPPRPASIVPSSPEGAIQADQKYEENPSKPAPPPSTWGVRKPPTIQTDPKYEEHPSEPTPPPSTWGTRQPQPIQADQKYEEHDF